MTDTEQKALALLRKVEDERGTTSSPGINRVSNNHEALCRAIEQHEAFRQEVSDALEKQFMWLLDKDVPTALRPFIIAKPDPLVEVLAEAMRQETNAYRAEDFAKPLRAALAARGLKIVEVGHD